jgi:hypothetical protein
LLGDVSQPAAIPAGVFQWHESQIARHLLAASQRILSGRQKGWSMRRPQLAKASVAAPDGSNICQKCQKENEL